MGQEYDWEGLAAADVVAVDCEASGLFPDDGARVSCVACAWKDGSLALPFDQGVRDKLKEKESGLLQFGDTEVDPNLEEDEWKQLLWMLRNKRLVFHNAGFDLIMLSAGTRHWNGTDLGDVLHWDTMIAHRILRPNSSAGLDNAARELGVGGKQGLDEVKAWLRSAKKSKGRYDLVPWRTIEPYVRGDAETTLALYEEQVRHFKEEPDDERVRRLRECRREFDLAVVLMRMEQRGLRYDAERSLQAAEEMEGKCADIVARLPFKLTPAGARKYFLEQGLAVDRTTAKGAPSIDKEQIRDWAEEGVEWAAEYRDATKAKRAASMWYRGYAEKLGEDGRLRCRYRQTKQRDDGGDSGARSGRLSAERVNLQAMPKGDKIEVGMVGVRDLLLAKKGHSLIALDMSQAELRCAAKYSECKTMLDMLSEGVDFHGKTTEDVMHVGRNHSEWKLKRDIGKKLTFSAVFGIGGEGFQKLLTRETGIHLALVECDRLVADWRRTYPEIMKAYRRAERVFRERGYVRILPGTEYESKSWLAEGDWPHTGWNRMVQGSLAAWLRLWLVEIEHDVPGALVLTVHDSVVLELPKRTAKKTAQKIADKASERASSLFNTSMKVDLEVYVK
jgi:DNA polymerase I-like protein with 3'-5' exonuclease and polymerase domains